MEHGHWVRRGRFLGAMVVFADDGEVKSAALIDAVLCQSTELLSVVFA